MSKKLGGEQQAAVTQTSPTGVATLAANCANCGSGAVARFCPDCGQRQLTREQYSLSHLVGELFGNLLQWDSKLLRTLKLALGKPGELSAQYLAGAKVRYTSPVTLLLLVFFLFFISPQLTDFTQPLNAHLKWGPWYSAPAVDWIEQKITAHGGDRDAYGSHFAEVQTGIAKTTVLLHVPLFALVLLLLHWRRRFYFVEHLIVASHYVAAMMLVFFLALLLIMMPVEYAYQLAGQPEVPDTVSRKLIMFGLNLPFVVLMFATLTHGYRQRWYLALMKTPLAILGFGLAHMLYRAITFYLTLLFS